MIAVSLFRKNVVFEGKDMPAFRWYRMLGLTDFVVQTASIFALGLCFHLVPIAIRYFLT